jgi:putative restriction endonuclease
MPHPARRIAVDRLAVRRGSTVRGHVAITDPGWYEHLARDPRPKDANFWRPSIRPVNLPVGAPFFFKLKAPFNAIAGVGFFAGFSILPDWLAWETFGEANGVASLEDLRARLAGIQRGASIDADLQGRIGCSLIAEAQFFPRSDWVKPPADLSPRTQTGKSYDLESGEGSRIWDACRERMWSRAADSAAFTLVEPARGAPALRRPRLGQGIFRVSVLDAYGRACAVSGEHSLPVLEAAHIVSFAHGGPNEVRNGLALRSDLHRLFDLGYVTVDPEHRFVVSRRLADDFGNGRSYCSFHGQSVALPADVGARPAVAALGWHRENRFLG